MKKRFSALFLVLAMLLSVFPTTAFAAAHVPFQDVASNAWYYDAVSYVSSKGIMSGVGNGNFSPEKKLTRAQLCQILYNMESKPIANSGSFTDVDVNDWFKDAVNWAAANEIVNGTGNGQFSPNKDITREQVATILYRYAKNYRNYDMSVPVSLADYSDETKVNTWAEDAMKWAVSEQIINGTTATTLSPQGMTTRAQAAAMLMRFCQRMEAKEAFYAKGIDDFNGETVINFDASDETNFAVLVEDAIAAESDPSANLLVSADEDEGVYVFSHIDQAISSLAPGDVLYITCGDGADDYLLLKVGGIEINGDTATVTEGKADLSDYFQYIDVDMEVDLSQEGNRMAYGQGSAAPSILAYIPCYQSPYWSDVAAPSLLADDITGSTALDIKFGFTGDVFSVTGNVKFTFKIKISYDKTLFDVEEITLSVKQETSLDGKISQKAKKDVYKEETPEVSIPITTGINANFSAFFKFEAEATATGSISGKITTESGTKYCGGKALPIRESDTDFSVDLGGNIKISTDVGVTGEVVVFKVIRLSISGEAGAEIKGDLSVIQISVPADEKHLCAACTDGTIDVYFKLTFEAKVGRSKKSAKKLMDIDLAKVTIEIAKFYVSLAGGATVVEFGWGKCPHKQYLVTVTVTDEKGNKLEGATVDVSNSNTGYIAEVGQTAADGTFRLYCDNGAYSITALLPDYETGYGDVTVNGGAKDVNVIIENRNTTKIHTVNFNANGGSVSINQKQVTAGGTYGDLPTPIRNGYTFDGWYTATNGGVKITSSSVVTGNQTLYAHWIQNSANPTSRVTRTTQLNLQNANTSKNEAEGWYWDSETKTLTLDNVNFNVSDEPSALILGSATIVLKGTNTIKSSYNNLGDTYNTFGIYAVGGDLVFEGDGTLTAIGGTSRGGSFGIATGLDITGSMTVNSGTITAIGGTSVSFGSYGIRTPKLFMDGGSLTATGGDANDSSYGIHIYGGILEVNRGELRATSGTAKNPSIPGATAGIYLGQGGRISIGTNMIVESPQNWTISQIDDRNSVTVILDSSNTPAREIIIRSKG